jgi:hypothetical protein
MRKRWGAAVLFLVTACGNDFAPVVELPDPPENGVQLLFKQITIQPQEDVEFCTYFQLETREMLEELEARAFDKEGNLLDDPFLLQQMTVNNVDLEADEIAIGEVEIVASAGLHHVQLLALENDTFDYDESHIFECGADLFGGPLTGDVEPLFFTSLPDYNASYEAGTARILKRTVDHEFPERTRGAQLLYNFHYLNTTDEPIEAEVVVNFHTVPRDSVVHPIRSAWWNYIYFNAEAGVESSTLDEAHGSFKVDVELVGMTSHQHELGTLFTYTRGEEELYSNDTWAEPDYLQFPRDTILPAGEDLRFHCEWQNLTAEDRFFGLQADDEMCTAIIEYHPVDEEAAAALLEQLQMEADEMGEDAGFFTGGVSLETFYPMPDSVIAEIQSGETSPIDVLDGEIMCGVAQNMKELEDKYGRAPDTLAELQRITDLLAGICDLE